MGGLVDLPNEVSVERIGFPSPAAVPEGSS